ncbi:hypothetical protein Ddye_007224 [Dipteronia dyeriana]|uniref:TLDc domain-containing protein n=1 Tax=Dipteronia dyeriana TaxID=168575 RepID=A0AAD9XJF3_9ROSI|nr:hypothetical protein Ddye_007224 [Dipteronia dyeriana]
MGASSSTQQNVSSEQKTLENLAASTGALPTLQSAFSNLADPQTNAIPIQSLQQCFSLNCKNLIWEAVPMKADSFPGSLDHVAPAIVDLFFVPEKGGLSWVEFVRGYVKCCGRMLSSMLFNTLLRVFVATVSRAGLTSKLEFESDEPDCKITGSLLPVDVLMILCMCWTLAWDARSLSISKGNADVCLPDVSDLVLSAVVSCSEVGSDLNLWDCNILDLEAQLPAGKFLSWALTTVPTLTDCFTQFVPARLQNCVASKDVSGPSTSSPGEISSTTAHDTYLLSCGRAWAISLTFRSSLSEEIMKIYCPGENDGPEEKVIYRSSLHGRGLNRFWSNVEGYHGPLLILISANSGDGHEGDTSVRKWIIGALTQQGFENKDDFYGSSGTLYAISPVFHAFSASGKEKNFVYSHLHPTGVYERHPKPVGIAFGGTLGNERILIDEDFATVTVRHHAADKTYLPGSLFPHQGFLTVEAPILEVEVWGLGGKTARKTQTSYKKREELFTEQRRKVDLKTFSNWEDSPENMMMDMISNPNSVRREDR